MSFECFIYDVNLLHYNSNLETMKKILVPTDFSECAINATDVAISIAKKMNAEVLFFHSASLPIDWKSLTTHTASDINLMVKEKESRYPEMRKKVGEVKQQLADLVQLAKGKGIDATSSLTYNLTHQDIISHATSFKADLIVMGTNGSNGIKELFLGSNTQKVIRLAKCPVLTIREKQHSFSIKDIVFVSDFEEQKVKDRFDVVLKFADLFDAHIHLLYVNTPIQFEDTKYSQKKMDELILNHHADNQNISSHIFNEYSAEEGALRFAKSINADMIAIVSHGYKGLRKIISENITERLANHSHIPVLGINLD